jgi:hypothetical protein
VIKGMTARQVARLLVVCGVGNGKCRGQVIRIQERKRLKPRPMLAVRQLTDVRGGCERQRQRMESTLLEGRGRARRRLGEAQDADQGEMVTQVMPDGGRNQSGGVRAPRESGRDSEASRALAGGVRGREREMQGPGDPGEEATPDARSVSAHGRAGGVRGRQRELMGRTLLEMRGRARRRLGEAQDADEGEFSRRSCLVAGAQLTAIGRVPSHSHARGLSELWIPESCRCWVPNAGWTPQQSRCPRSLTGWSSLRM